MTHLIMASETYMQCIDFTLAGRPGMLTAAKVYKLGPGKATVNNTSVQMLFGTTFVWIVSIGYNKPTQSLHLLL